MKLTTYLNIQLAVSSILLILGAILLFRRIPDNFKNTPFNTSSKLMGIAFCVLPAVSYIYYFSNIRYLNEYYTTAINISGYYPTSALIHLSLLALIGEKIDFKSIESKLYISSFFIFPAILFTLLNYIEPEKVITIGNTLLFSIIIAQISYFYVKYTKVPEKTNHKYFSEIEIHIKWIKKSVYIFGSLAFFACIAPKFFDYPMWLGIFYISCSLAIFTYIYNSYYRFIISYKEVFEVDNETKIIEKHDIDNKIEDKIYNEVNETIVNKKEKRAKNTLSPELIKHIDIQIALWLNRKEYCKNDVSIITMAEELKTNRTYLSTYINSTYNYTTFKAWITKLRIEEAKRLLTSHHSYTITEVAEKSGFSSHTSFIHVFGKMEGVSPSRWKKLQK